MGARRRTKQKPALSEPAEIPDAEHELVIERARRRRGQGGRQGVCSAARQVTAAAGERYRRLVKRRGRLKALVAVARSILVIVWQLLSDPTARFPDLGPRLPHTSRGVTERKIRNHIAHLTAMGFHVILQPAA